jgi:hypothetical protein
MLTRVIDINLMTCMYTCMAVVPYMKNQRSGKIVTASSVAGVAARGGYHPYGTAKAAIIHYTRALAQELGPHNINVNSIATGPRGDQYRSYPVIEESVHDMDFADADEEYIRNVKEKAFSQAERISGTRKGADPGSYDGKPAMIIHSENLVAINDSSAVCRWTTPFRSVYAYTLERQAELISLGLGKEITTDMLQRIAERIRCLERAFDIGQGLDRSQETLPKRFFELKPVSRDAPLDPKEFEEMKSEYYSLRGWDIATGAPTEETLKRFGLDDVAGDLEKQGKLPVSA